MSELDRRKTELIRVSKAAFRAAEAGKTWEQRVAAIFRMNKAMSIARQGMRKSLERKKETS